MNKIQKIISSLVVLVSISLIVVFKTVPVTKLWDKYIVFYVPSEISDKTVVSSLTESGINDYVSLSNQYLPLNISQNSIEYAMYKTSIESSENDYINNRKSYFFDKSNSYRLYYIPVEYNKKINKCMALLKDKGINSSIDRNGSYPFMYPLVILLITIVICYFSKNKIFFLISTLIPVIYVFCNPFFPVSIGILLLVLCLFLISNIWKRAGAIKYLKRFFILPLCLIATTLCCFSGSLISGFMFIVAIIGTIGILISYYWIENLIREKKSFVPVYIRPAKMVSLFSGKIKTVFSIVSGSSLFLLILFLFTSSGIYNHIGDKIQLPSSSSVISEELPQLEDYYEWTWNFITYPYKSLNDNNSEKYTTSIIFPTYEVEETSGLIKTEQKKLNYNEEYKETVFTEINQLPFNSIEKVMSSEGKEFTGGYKSTCSYHIDLFGIIMIIICYSILLFIYFSIIIRKGKRRRVLKNDNK